MAAAQQSVEKLQELWTFFFFLQSTANPAGRTELIAKPKLMKPLTACALFTGRALLSYIRLFALQLSAGLMIWASLCLCEFGLPFLLSFFLLREMSVKKKKKRGRALLQPAWYQLFKCFPSPEEDTPLPVFQPCPSACMLHVRMLWS